MFVSKLALYRKNGSSGKGSRHADTSSISNIMAASGMVVQVYEQALGSRFREEPQSCCLRANYYDHIMPQLDAWLYALMHDPHPVDSFLGSSPLSSRCIRLFRLTAELMH
jgi:hypothetical protein